MNKPLNAGARNLQRLCSVRTIVLFAETTGLLLAGYLLALPVPVLSVSLVLSLNALVIVGTLLRIRFPQPGGHRELFTQLLFDLFSQATLFYLTGGYTNPFISVFLVTVIMGALLLPLRYSWGLSCLSIVVYTLLMKWYQPLTGHTAGHGGQHTMSTMAIMHLSGMWLTYTLSTLLINFFVVRMAEALREERAVVAQARERQLRDEHLLAVATTAAGAAHELGTPLATMAVVLGDLSEEHQDNPVLSDDIKLLKTQVDECKKRLNRLVTSSQRVEPNTLAATEFLADVLDEWQLLRPHLKPVTTHVDPCHQRQINQCQISVDSALPMALINLLNNAADASPEPITVTLKLAEQTIIIEITDNGPGFDLPPGKTITSPSISMKKEGLGLGLQLSQATIERGGGEVRLYRRPEGGTLTAVALPVTPKDAA
ncbi:ATP-binding protein [Kistimonas asteriae]|uniref:ATP-binding protein n=1 Tax=Kistimonas asteriae TaxID=517724 RepID=UPI001BA5A3B2|nr:ATP-binding protein [Kistimonas asteriae]